MPACSKCGKPYEGGERFCSACGTELASESAAPRELRKTVTVVFSDVANSTRLGEQLDPESHRRVMGSYFEAMRAVLERHGGTVEKFIGDAVMAVFGIPVLHEDDALRAVRAAAEMRDAVVDLNRELRRDRAFELSIRTGVNTGEVVAGEPGTAQTLVTGDAVVVAKRLEETAAPDEIQLGEGTYRLVKDNVAAEPLGPLSAKGKQAIPAWRLVDVLGAEVPLRLDSPIVGRAGDLATLEGTFDLVEEGRSCHLFTVLGPAGIGKSRLIHEFVSELGDRATVLRGRCLPYGDGITFWPLVEVVKQAAELTDHDSAEEAQRKIGALLPPSEDSRLVCQRVAAAVGRGEAAAARPDETFWAVRRLFEALARERPLVVVIDDVQWAESTFLDLLEYIAGWTTRAAVLLCCLARPDLLELRPSWGLPKPNAAAILLKPLREHETGELVDNLLGRLPLPAEAQARISTSAEGNPLFVEELVRMLVDEGVLHRQNGGWAADDVGELAVPPTIQALLSARLDRLDPDERAIIQRASVAGQVFWWGAVAELSPHEARADVGAHLQSLVRKELIRQEPSALEADDAFRFGHILIRDAAYTALPKEARAELHERLANWLERKTEAEAIEYEEIVGYHLEQAVLYRRELGSRYEAIAELALQAGGRLAGAGRRAAARADAPAAANLLGRALLLLPDGALGRDELLVQLAEALHEVGELHRARELLEEARDRAVAAGDAGLEVRAELELANWRPQLDPESTWVDDLQSAGERAVEVFERLGDDRGLARALSRVAVAHWLRCRVEPIEPLLERALRHALRAGDARELSNIRYGLVRAAALGPLPADEAVRRCERILDEAAGDRVAEAAAANALAYLEAMRGRFDEARVLVVRSRTILEDLGLVLMAAVLDAWTGHVEMFAGDPAAAERLWRSAYETLERFGERGNLSTIAAFLAEAVQAQGRDEEAERFTEVSEQATSRDDVTSQVAWRVTRSKLCARRGDVEGGERLAREAVERADETDWPSLRGAARTSLAEVMLAAGRAGEAAEAGREALEIYEAKGNVAAAAQVRELLDGMVSAGTVPGERAS
jgi:class 3 adenylate cyclase/tetratricopeptide (TPR) repeat protein